MQNKIQAAVYGTGSYLPERRQPNSELENSLGVALGWIYERTGIRFRHVAAPEEATSDLCAKAAFRALENSGIDGKDIDLILIATITGDFPGMPSTACLVQKHLGLAQTCCAAMDVVAACSGFVYGLATAKAYVESGLAKHVLVAGGEMLTRILDYQSIHNCLLFGDGAGAVVVGPHRTSGPSHIISDITLHADGSGEDLLKVPAGGSRRSTSAETLANREQYVRMDGQSVFRFGVTKVIEMIHDTLRRKQWTAADLGRIIPHQANARLLRSVAMQGEIPEELFFQNLETCGNTSAASVPIALDEAARGGKIPHGKPALLLGFGGGLTWSSAVLEW